MYGWRARIGNISPTTCAEILPYLVIRDARESSQVEASWRKFDTAFEDLLHTRVDHITLSGAPLVLANGVDRHRELLQEFRSRFPVPIGTSPQSFAGALKYLGAVKLAVATSFIPAHNELVRAFLISEGFDVLGIESLDTGMTTLEKALLSPTQVFRHVRAVGRKYATCDAVLITSSAWPTLTVIQPLEDDLGKPVVSSSVGQIWWPLKELGIRAEINGYGKLLGTLS
jgi:arylmalonate decarboxylase